MQWVAFTDKQATPTSHTKINPEMICSHDPNRAEKGGEVEGKQRLYLSTRMQQGQCKALNQCILRTLHDVDELQRTKRRDGLFTTPTQVCMKFKNPNKPVPVPKWLPIWMCVCELCFTVMYSIYMCFQLYRARGINDVTLNKKIKFVCLFVQCIRYWFM